LILLVLFYTVELTFNQGGRIYRALLGTAGVLLAVIAVRGLVGF
jgi:hypothetical protein